MALYNKVDTNLNFVDREKEILKFWQENKIFEKTIELREGNEPFTFWDGPPTANGMPHIGHVLTRAIKDIIPRYRTMKGYDVQRKAAWDTHGLPVELEIEKKLGIENKTQLEAYGIEPFIEQCKESVWKYKSEWETMSAQVGFWADMENASVTYSDNYIESVWWAIKTIFEKDLIYKGHKIVPYCPRCGTSLSSHEVAQGYKNVKEDSVIAKFTLKDSDNTHLLAWTTTPWTLPSNVGLVVNPKEKYVKLEKDGEFFILAEALVSAHFEEEAYTIVESYVGQDLEYLEYKPLFNFVELDKKAHFVTCDDYVTLSDGTGIVHTAPAFGEDDAKVGRKYDLPFLQPVNGEGKFTEEVTPWAGLFVKDADPQIIEELTSRGLVFKVINDEHNYPHCWRCDTPLLYYARSTWFIEMTKLRGNLVANNNKVNWVPETIKDGRFGNFLENVIDWSLSRERYWGTPLPLWICDDCGHIHAVGSKDELKRMATDCPDDIELHKPYIDNVHLSCDKCSGNMTRVSEVIDVWFDSGCLPFAQWHYPFENKDMFEKNFPADFISEAIDQTRGWFYTLMAISTLLFDKEAYKNVVVLGHVQDKNGSKMSKSKGNAVSPADALEKHGADAVRWYFYSNSNPWLPSRFYDEAVEEGQRKFMGTFWNTYAFYILYANIDSFNPYDYKLYYDKLDVMDKWILSKLNTLVEIVDDGLSNYKLTETSRAMNSFVDELSNWYVRRSRERFWASGMPQEKINAFMTLHTVLVTLSQLSAPFTPFMADEVYRNLVVNINSNEPISVHLTDFPKSNKDLVNIKLEEEMAIVLDMVTVGRSARNTANIKNRQPIGNMLVKSPVISDGMVNVVKDELNVKEVSFIENADKYVSYSFKPQLKTLGRKYGKLVPGIGNYLKEVNSAEFYSAINEGSVKFEVMGEEVELTIDDVLMNEEQTEGYASASLNGVTVILDTNLSDELIEEGFVREITSKIQTMRKDSNFEVLDNIRITFKGNEKLTSIIKNNAEEIKSVVLGNEIVFGDISEKKWNINGEDLFITIEKI